MLHPGDGWWSPISRRISWNFYARIMPTAASASAIRKCKDGFRPRVTRARIRGDCPAPRAKGKLTVKIWIAVAKAQRRAIAAE